MTFIDKLKKMGACKNAIRWLKRRKFKTFQQAWDACRNDGYMWWYLDEVGASRNLSQRRYEKARVLWREVLFGKAECDAIRKVYPRPPKLPRR